MSLAGLKRRVAKLERAVRPDHDDGPCHCPGKAYVIRDEADGHEVEAAPVRACAECGRLPVVIRVVYVPAKLPPDEWSAQAQAHVSKS